MREQWVVSVLGRGCHWWRAALILLASLPWFWGLGQTAQAEVLPQKRGESAQDQIIVQMYEAYDAQNQEQLSTLLPQAKGHFLEPWAAYWELSGRLEEASPQEVQAFLQRYAGSYQEDRLRNDWMLLLGERQQWSDFLSMLSAFRMNDDPNVVCYGVLARGAHPKDATLVLESWQNWGHASEACSQAAAQLFAQKSLQASDLWPLARLGVDQRDWLWVQQVVDMLAPELKADVALLMRNPGRYLKKRSQKTLNAPQQEVAVLALMYLAAKAPKSTAALMQATWEKRLSPEQVAWAWGRIGKSATFDLIPDAFNYFALAKNTYLNDYLLQWKVRSALRAGRWDAVLAAISAMTEQGQKKDAWKYWKARALAALGHKNQAQTLLQQIAANGSSPSGFYEQLALEALGQSVRVPPVPAPIVEQEEKAIRASQGLQRALYAFDLGLRSAGVREWNYEISLSTPGGLPDRARLVASEWACAHAVWDRCINTSESAQAFFHAEQRYPMPYQETVLKYAQEAGLSLADVYGLIRQESRFIRQARSNVGASGLMQVMEGTARFVVEKKQIKAYRDDLLSDLAMNLQIGTHYLKMLVDDFQNSKPLALAAYNAGPRRARRWRAVSPLESAIWVETIPFFETREYVKKVLANSVFYAAILGQEPISINAQLGAVIGPRDPNAPAQDEDLP